MEFNVNTTPNDDGFCSTFTTLGGAVAGEYFFAFGNIPVTNVRRLIMNRCCKRCCRSNLHIPRSCLRIFSKRLDSARKCHRMHRRPLTLFMRDGRGLLVRRTLDENSGF